MKGSRLAPSLCLLSLGCSDAPPLVVVDDIAGVGGGAGVGGTSGAGGSAGAGVSGGMNLGGEGGEGTAPTERFLCVFDYDLTLSSHGCGTTLAEPERYLCRRNVDACPTYGWFDQCVGVSARDAVEECVRRGAYLGIASHSIFTDCWADKIVSLFSPENFPLLFASPHYASNDPDFVYPDLLDPSNYNCDDCAYQIRGESKSALIRRVMAHYGMDANDLAAQRRVAFWDDDLNNTRNVMTELPAVVTVKVPVLGDPAAREGCGIGPGEIAQAWSRLEAR